MIRIAPLAAGYDKAIGEDEYKFHADTIVRALVKNDDYKPVTPDMRDYYDFNTIIKAMAENLRDPHCERIPVIKMLRALKPGLGLKEAKDMIEVFPQFRPRVF